MAKQFNFSNIDELKKYGIKVPVKLIDRYQRYISLEMDRGIRRNGLGYDENELNLVKYWEEV